MGLDTKTRSLIKDLLVTTVRSKIEKYSPETVYRPFHTKLIGGDRYAVFSFIQSFNTTFGMSIWEQVSVILAKSAGYNVERQYKLLGSISAETAFSIEKIHNDIRTGVIKPSVKNELKSLKQAISKGLPEKNPDSTVDLYITVGKNEYYFDITSVKPNQKEFVELKRKLLKWKALILSTDNKAQVYTRLAIPYNPYYPDPYERWTLSGLFDLEHDEVMIGADYWDFVGGGIIYDSLLDVFGDAGKDLRPDLDKKFAKFK